MRPNLLAFLIGCENIYLNIESRSLHIINQAIATPRRLYF